MSGYGSVTPVAALARWPGDAPALAWPGGSWSYRELAARVELLAAAAEPIGVAGSTLAIVSRSRRQAALGALAALRLGRAALMLDPARRDAAACLEAAAAGAAIADPDLELPPGIRRIDFAGVAVPGSGVVRSGPCAAAPPTHAGAGLLVPTSGTTGVARIARLPARALDAHVIASGRALPPLQRGGRWLVCLPIATIGALATLWRTLAVGACYALLERFDVDAARGLLATPTTHASVVPAMLEPLVRDQEPPPALRCLLAGGGPLTSEAAALARARGWPLWTSWGMTETASHVAVGPVGSDWREGIVGRLLPGVEVEVDPSSSRLVVGGPMLMAGYLTADAGLRADGRFVTGDLGEFLADGRLRILGRADDVIVTAGVNVHPQAVEDVLASCPGVAAVAVTARRDARWGTTLVALFEGDVDPATLDRWARERIDPAARPRAYLRVAALPRNAMGKLVRHELPALLTGEAGDR
jgi:O-succinylbenzoic acid--CoA ligase